MFIPFGDEPNPEGTPWATYGLIAVNVAVWVLICRPAQELGVNPTDSHVLDYLATMREATGLSRGLLLQQTSAYEVLTYTYGFRPRDPSALALITSLFLHGGWMHLLGNMLFLWIFGDNIEARLGRVRYLLLYGAAGILATLFYALFRYNSPYPLIGASGAISGILGAYFIWFGHHRVRVLAIIIIFIQVIHVPARWVLGFYLVVENLLPFLVDPGTASTAYGAHIGGFFAGALFALAYGHYEAYGTLGNLGAWLETAREARATAQVTGERPQGAPRAPTARHVVDALERGQPDLAHRLYERLPDAQRIQMSAADTFALADALTRGLQMPAAAAILQRYLSDHQRGPVMPLARAHLRLGLLQLRGMNRPVAAREHLWAVIDLFPHSDEAEAASAALASLDPNR